MLSYAHPRSRRPLDGCLGAVFTDKLIIEPLTDLIRVVNQRMNSPHYRRIARLFHVLGNCLTSLAKYWDTLVVPSVPVTSMEHPRYFPHVKSYTSNNLTTSFQYLRRWIFKTRSVLRFSQKQQALPALVSLSSSWSNTEVEAQTSADVDLAPKLLYHGPLDSSTDAPSHGSLRMVVMEEVEGTNAFVLYQDREAPDLFLASVREAVRELHTYGFVFGDLRRQNIMVTPDGKVKLIDLIGLGRMVRRCINTNVQ